MVKELPHQFSEKEKALNRGLEYDSNYPDYPTAESTNTYSIPMKNLQAFPWSCHLTESAVTDNVSQNANGSADQFSDNPSRSGYRARQAQILARLPLHEEHSDSESTDSCLSTSSSEEVKIEQSVTTTRREETRSAQTIEKYCPSIDGVGCLPLPLSHHGLRNLVLCMTNPGLYLPQLHGRVCAASQPRQLMDMATQQGRIFGHDCFQYMFSICITLRNSIG